MFDEINERVNNFIEQNPTGFLAACSVVGFGLAIPVCAFIYQLMGKVAGKAAAKELIDAGVMLGYNHK